MRSLLNLCMEYMGVLLTIVVAILILVIGLKIDHAERKFKAQQKVEKLKKQRAEAHQKRLIIEQMSPRAMAMHLKTHLIKTVNIYYSPKINFNLHKQMLHQLRLHLDGLGFKNGMTDEDKEKMQHYINPVLVICPSLMKYFYHPNQEEDRTNCLDMTIETNDINYLTHEIDNIFTILEVKDENITNPR